MLACSNKILNESAKSPILRVRIQNSARPATDCRYCARRSGT